MTLSLNGYLARLIAEDLSMEHSLVALCDGKPAGFLLNGIRDCGAFRVAWNGGTGVKPEFRRLVLAKHWCEPLLIFTLRKKSTLRPLKRLRKTRPRLRFTRSCPMKLSSVWYCCSTKVALISGCLTEESLIQRAVPAHMQYRISISIIIPGHGRCSGRASRRKRAMG
jgi:hypothetical protein